ncbi:NADH-quinone oxidoreductase subunit H [Pseudomonadota bacterium]
MQDFLIEISQRTLVLITFALFSVVMFSILEKALISHLELRHGNKKTKVGSFFLPFLEFKDILNKTITLPNQNKFLFTIIPILFLLNSIIVFSIIPIGENLAIFDTQYNLYHLIFFLFLQCIIIFLTTLVNKSSTKTFIVAKKIKFSLFYLFVFFLSFLIVSVFSSSANLNEIVLTQNPVYFLFPLFPIFIICFIISIFTIKELYYYDGLFNSDYDSEYSGILLLMFNLGKRLGVLSISGIIVTLFLGGYGGFLNPILQVTIYFLKVLLVSAFLILGVKLVLNNKLKVVINVIFKVFFLISIIWLLLISLMIFYR